MRRFMVALMAAALLSSASAVTLITTTSVTLRKGPSVSTAKLAVIPAGTSLNASCSAGWCKVTYRTTPGFVAQSLLRAPGAAGSFSLPASTARTNPSTSVSRGAVSYRSCAEARAAGAAPIRKGQPGYSRRLDRDGDGIACDR